MNQDKQELPDELRQEYDFSQMGKSVRGKYTAEYQKENNLILLEPDVAKAFPDSESVNKALRLLIEIASRWSSL